MIKFVLILVSVLCFNFIISYTNVEAEAQPKEVAIAFSDPAIAIESGQPVYAKGTKVWLSNPLNEDMKLFINEEVKEVKDAKVDLNEITHLVEGTYTLVVNTQSGEKVYGFTIQ